MKIKIDTATFSLYKRQAFRESLWNCFSVSVVKKKRERERKRQQLPEGSWELWRGYGLMILFFKLPK